MDKVQNSTYSEYGYVAYEIKWNDACINMVANILPVDLLPQPWGRGQKVKTQFFQNMVMLHIKVKGMLCLYAYPRPLVEVKGQNNFFLKVVMLHIKLKGWNIEHHAST